MKLADICEINPRAELLDDNTLVSFVAMPDVSEDGKINVDTHRTYGEVKKGFTNFKEGDVLFAKITPCMENGKGALATGLENGLGFGSTEFHVLRPNATIVLGQWLYYLTSWSAFRKDAEKHMTGSAGQKRVPKSFLEKYEVDLPTIDDQEYQVLQLNRIREIIDARRQQLSALDDLIKARFVEMFGDPEHNSKSWPVQPLDSLCSVGSSKRIYQNEQSADGVPFWRISDLVSKMNTGVADSGLFIPEEKYLELRQSGLVPMAGDILVTSRGTLGRCYIIQEEDRFYFQDGMISWLSNYAESITPLYLQHLFTMNGFRKQIDGMQAGSTVAYLSIAMLKKLRIMVPSEEVQSEFAAFVAQIDKSKSVIQKSLDETQLLFDSLMQEYFG